MLLESDVPPRCATHTARALDLRLRGLEGSPVRAGNEGGLLCIARRATELRDDLRSRIMAGDWITDAAKVSGVSARIDVRFARSVSLGLSRSTSAPPSHPFSFDCRVPTVVCKSATLRPRGRAALTEVSARGPSEGRGQLVLPSPVISRSRAALYLPDDMPEACDPLFEDARHRPIVELVGDDGGARS